MDNSQYPLCVLLFSGKRKCGKDYFTDKLLELCNADEVALIKISLPIKSHFSKMYNLNLNDLLTSGEYKEKYRMEMIKWSDEMRRKDPGVFCRAAVEMSYARKKPIWIVSDIRRKTDISWFKENYGEAVKTVRIETDDNIRKERGWAYMKGIDDAPSECDLDDYSCWHWKIDNNGDTEKFNIALSNINNFLKGI